MARNLSDDDVEAVAQRVISVISERLAAPQSLPAQSDTPTEKDPATAPLRLSYTRKQLCEELSLSPDTLYKLENQGLLRPLPGIRHKIYSRSEVERFLSSGKAKW